MVGNAFKEYNKIEWRIYNLMKQIFIGSVCLAALLFFVGCGPKGKGLKTEYVEGVVTLDGTPVPEGTSVRFIPATSGTGEAAGGVTDKNGVYTLSSVNGDPGKGALQGDYKIIVSKQEISAQYEENDPKAPKDERGNQILTQHKETLPKVYTQARTTPLTYTVVEGKQKHDIELKSK